MKARSAKNKGARFENFLVELIRAELDPNAHRTYGSGSGLDKNDVIVPKYEIEIEAKNQQKIKLLDWWDQVERQRTPINIPVLVARDPRRPEFQRSFAICDLNDFLVLIGKEKPEVDKRGALGVSGDDHSNNATQFQLNRTIVELKKAIKILEER